MKIAINKNVIGKPANNDKDLQVKLTYSYKNLDITHTKLAELIKSGYAFCAQHKNKRRKSANFLASDFLAVDIDNGMTLEDAKAHEFVMSYASFIYTTASHTEEINRFRIVFSLEETVTNSQVMKDLYTGMAVKFGGDMACTDACRQFYGSKDCQVIFFNQTLPKNQIKDLLILGAERKKKRKPNRSSSIATPTATRSEMHISLDTVVRDDTGEAYTLSELTIGTRIHCPIHIDRSPSAFIIESKKGVIGIHCKTCNQTYFTSNGSSSVDFNYSLREFQKLADETITHTSDDGLTVYESKSIYAVDEEYLNPIETDASFIFVKSPKGSGKTKWLESAVKAVKKNDREEKKKNRSGILLIGHRQSLITALAERLGLQSYANFPTNSTSGITYNTPSTYYAICADSLSSRLDPKIHKYNTVIIDEVEQVLAHLTQATVMNKRNEIFLFFQHYISEAKKVYVMDADLNSLTLKTTYDLVRDKSRSMNLIINDYKTTSKEITLYQGKNHLVYDMLEAIREGNKIFVSSNSKKEVKNIEKIINESFKEQINVKAITSDNSSEPETQYFIRNIVDEIKKYDVVIASPTLGTGIDIKFSSDDNYRLLVFGFFHARVNTHFDIDQQISRVRDPQEVNIWISPQTFSFETSVESIKAEVRNNTEFSQQLIGIDENGVCEYKESWSDEYLNLYANVKSLEYSSKNNILDNFIDLKRHQGYKIKSKSTNKEYSDEGKIIVKLAKDSLKKERIDKLLSAKIISRKEYKILKGSSDTVTNSDEYKKAIERYEIESFYLLTITKELLELDNNGKYRANIRKYENYTQLDENLKDVDINEAKSGLNITDRKQLLAKKQLLAEILHSAGLADKEGKLKIEQPICKDELTDFVIICQRYKTKLAELFDMDINRDIRIKPTSQLGKILKETGISWKRSMKKIDGHKVYFYRISKEDVTQIEAHMNRRKDSEQRREWLEKQSKIKENRLFTSDNESIRLQINNHMGGT